jgi:hypothetical protein
MSPRDSQLSRRCTIEFQSVGVNALRPDACVPQKLPEQTHRSLGISTFLNEDVEDFAFVVNGSPQPHPLT